MKKKQKNLKKYLNKGVSTPVGILIVLLAATIVGILIWQFWPEQESVSGPEIDVGIIEGSLGYPSDFIPPDMKICAENIQTGEEYCTEEHIKDEKYTYGEGYKIEVAPGDYFVYASLSSWGEYNAYYSEFVTCGMKVECPSHEPILVSVEKGDIVIGIDTMDWYVIPEQEQEAETANWDIYRNQEWKFEMKYPKGWHVEKKYAPSKTTLPYITQLSFYADKNEDYSLYPWPKTFGIDICYLYESNENIIHYDIMGRAIENKNFELRIGGIEAKEFVWSSPDQVYDTGVHSSRKFIVRTDSFAYAFWGNVCWDKKDPICDQILSTFKFID